MDDKRLAELEELAKAGALTDDEQRELDELRGGLRITGLKLTDTRTGEVVLRAGETGEG